MTTSDEAPAGRERDSWILVPDASRTAVLVERASHGEASSVPKLPVARTEDGAASVVAALREAFALDAPYLRQVQILRNEERQPLGALHELDAPPPGWEPPDGTGWLALADADPQALAPTALAASIERWIDEQRGARIPDRRASWARPGWYDQATEWMLASAMAHGLEPRGRPELVGQWALSSVLRLETDAGHVYLKAVFPLFRHEPVLTHALAGRHPALLPELLAIDETRGWMLLRELRGVPLGDVEVERWSSALRAIAEIHRAWVGHEPELRALGAHDRTLDALAGELRELATLAELDADDRRRLDPFVPELERRCEQLARSELPQTLIHGDLHPWNVMHDGADVRIFDWSDGCVSHPLFDLPTFVSRAEEGERDGLVDAYLGAWADVAPPGELRRLYRLAQPLAGAHHAISYARIKAALPPDEDSLFGDVPRRWVASLLERLTADEAGSPDEAGLR